MDSITFLSTDELLSEVFNRFEHCIFSGLNTRRENILTKRKYKGNSDTCIGLAYKVQNWIVNDWEKDRKDFSEGNIEE